MKMTKTNLLAACAAILAVTWLLLTLTRTTVPAVRWEQKLEAAQRTQACLEAVRQLKEDRGIPISAVNDINRTGVIGQDYSLITTTLGNLEAKRTSTNPNMAAMVVDMFCELGLEPGDKVAVNCSGSFPALNLAVLCAIEVMELDPLLMTSFGSSTHGANDPELTYLDMEYALYQQGLLGIRSDCFSIGGLKDVGGDMDPAVVQTIVDRLTGFGYPFYYETDLLDNIHRRFAIYQDYGDIRCFINVGGNDVSFGNSKIIVYSDGGILTALPENDHSTGLVQLFLAENTPVIHLLNVKSLATAYGLPIDPSPIPPPGEGGVYCRYTYHKAIAWGGLVLTALMCGLGWNSLRTPEPRWRGRGRPNSRRNEPPTDTPGKI